MTKKNIDRVIAVFTGLLVLFFIEMMLTIGHAFDISAYNVFTWVCQVIVVLFATFCSLLINEVEMEGKYD